jgi:hypothetical protein
MVKMTKQLKQQVCRKHLPPKEVVMAEAFENALRNSV